MFVCRPGAQYFEVAEVSRNVETHNLQPPVRSFENIKQELAEAIKKEKVKRQITELEESKEPNTRLRRVGWASHLAGFDRIEMRELVTPIEDDELEL